MGSEFSCMKGSRRHGALNDLATRTTPLEQAQKTSKAQRRKSASNPSSFGANNSFAPQTASVPVGSQPVILDQLTETTASRTTSPTKSTDTIQHVSASRARPLVATEAPAAASDTLPRSKPYLLPIPTNIVASKLEPGLARPATRPSYASEPTTSTSLNVVQPNLKFGSTLPTKSRLERPSSEQWWHPVPAMNLGLWLEESKGAIAAQSSILSAIPKTEPTTGANALKAAKPGPLKNFTCFPFLPTEIRLLIWNKCCQVARVIRIEYERGSGQCTAHHRRPPTGLHVCRESREEALRVYRLAFGTAQVFINFDMDVICLDNGVSYQDQRMEPTTCLRQLLRHAGHDDIRSIRYLAVCCTQSALLVPMAHGPMAHTPPSYWDSHGAYFELPKFPNLERLIYAVEIPPDSVGYSGNNSTYSRMHQYAKARIRLIFPNGYWEVWLQHAIPYVDCVRSYLRDLEKARGLGWKAPELEIATLRVW